MRTAVFVVDLLVAVEQIVDCDVIKPALALFAEEYVVYCVVGGIERSTVIIKDCLYSIINIKVRLPYSICVVNFGG